MVLSQKERSLLEDLKGAEQLCIIKYTKYAEEACDPCLAELFNSIKAVEAGHLATVTRILAGDSVTAETPKSATEEKFTCTPSVCSAEAKKNDAYAVSINTPRKLRYKRDPKKDHFYIPERKKYHASVRFDVKGTNPLSLIILGVVYIVLGLIFIRIFPSLLKAIDTAMSALNGY